jgi:hypothetical protein
MLIVVAIDPATGSPLPNSIVPAVDSETLIFAKYN